VKVLEEKHTLATRWFHWINFPILSVMIYSGALIYWGYDPYRIGLGKLTLFHFFPGWFYDATGIDHQIAWGMALHFAFAWILAINGVAYVAYTVISGEWRELVPDRNSPREAFQVAMHDAGFKVPMPSQGCYNAAHASLTQASFSWAASACSPALQSTNRRNCTGSPRSSAVTNGRVGNISG